MKQPLLTIITPIYNTGPYVIKALECIKRQTFRDFEHIIFDDCSTDDSLTMVEKWIAENNHQCTLIKNEKNKGLPASLNIAKKMAKGKYVNGLGDDEWADNYLEKRIAHFEQQDEKVAVTISDVIYIDEQSDIIAKSGYAKTKVAIPEVIKSLNYIDMLNSLNIFAPSAITRRAVYDDVGYHDENLSFEDLDMWLRIVRKYDFAFFDEPLIYYRIRENSLSRKNRGTRFYIDWLNIYTKDVSALPKMNKSAKERFKKYAVNNYFHNKDVRTKFFLLSFKLNKDLKSLFLLCLCFFRIKPGLLSKVINMKSKIGT